MTHPTQGNHVGRLLLLDVKQGERQREFQKLHQARPLSPLCVVAPLHKLDGDAQ